MNIARTKETCCGCGACVQACPQHCLKMVEDSQGFLYPIVDESRCTHCSACEKVCPYLNRYDRPKDTPHSYACRTTNEELRANSSSGGLFSILAEHVINQGGVVFGARFAEDWTVVHDFTETKEGLAVFRGSKYVQSIMGDNFIKVREFLKEGRLVLFSGTPCQIAGLNHFLHKKYDNLLTIDIVCHCVPSPKVWRAYLEEVRNNRLVSHVSFRNKSDGWTSYGLIINEQTMQNKQDSKSILTRGSHRENTYMRAFLSNLIVRPGCTDCPARNYTSGSDITLGDCWGFGKYHPEIDDNKGMSLALIHTDKGAKEYQAVQQKLYSLKIPYAEVEDRGLHKPITKSPQYHHYHQKFFKAFNKGGKSTIFLMEEFLERDKKRKLRIKKFRQTVSNIIGPRLINITKQLKGKF